MHLPSVLASVPAVLIVLVFYYERARAVNYSHNIALELVHMAVQLIAVLHHKRAAVSVVEEVHFTALCAADCLGQVGDSFTVQGIIIDGGYFLP